MQNWVKWYVNISGVRMEKKFHWLLIDIKFIKQNPAYWLKIGQMV